MRASLKEKIAARIGASRDLVFLTREFLDLGGRDQVLRALRKLCADGVVTRIGYGLYAKSRRNQITGETIVDGSPLLALRQAFDKLDVEWEESCAVKDYNAGRSTQIPVNPIPKVKGRFSRKITINGREAQYDRVQ